MKIECEDNKVYITLEDTDNLSISDIMTLEACLKTAETNEDVISILGKCMKDKNELNIERSN